jgi:hypothetical protein
MTTIFETVGDNSPTPASFDSEVVRELSRLFPGNAQYLQAIGVAQKDADAGWASEGRTQADLGPIYQLANAVAVAKTPADRTTRQNALETFIQSQLDQVGDSSAEPELAIQTRATYLAQWGPQQNGGSQPAFGQALLSAQNASLNRVSAKIATTLTNVYNNDGDTAFANALSNATDPTIHPDISPEMAARILISLTATFREVSRDVGDGSAGVDPSAVIEGIMKAVGNAAINSDPLGTCSPDDGSCSLQGTWESPVIQQAVEGTAKTFAQNLYFYSGGDTPGWSGITAAITHAVGDGANPTFALELANQIQPAPLVQPMLPTRIGGAQCVSPPPFPPAPHTPIPSWTRSPKASISRPRPSTTMPLLWAMTSNSKWSAQMTTAKARPPLKSRKGLMLLTPRTPRMSRAWTPTKRSCTRMDSMPSSPNKLWISTLTALKA